MVVSDCANLCNFLKGYLNSNMQMRSKRTKIWVGSTYQFQSNQLNFYFSAKPSPFTITILALVEKNERFGEKK